MDKFKIHHEIMDKFDKAYSYDYVERGFALEDDHFVNDEDGQWDDNATSKRRNRPRYTVDKVSPAISQIIGEYRQKRVDIKVRPKRDGNSELSDVFAGIIKNIEINSRAQNAYDIAFKSITVSGFGAWRVTTDYESQEGFEQTIKVVPITSPLDSVWVSPKTRDPNGRDSSYIFVTMEMSKDEFEDRFEGAIPVSFQQGERSAYHRGWVTGDLVRVAEFWEKELVMTTIILLSNNEIVDGDKYEKIKQELASSGITAVKSRKVKTPRITITKVSGAEVLEEPKLWPGKFIPVILAYGFSSFSSGHHYYRGIVRKSKDPARIYNYTISTIVETSALAPKDPIWVTAAQVQGYEGKFRDYNIKNSPFMFYNPDNKAPGPPVRTGAPAFQQGLITQSQQAEEDIKATTGMFSPSLGDNPSNQSGVALFTQQSYGNRGTFELYDNLTKGIEFTGEILVDLIPRIYDSYRQERIIQPSGDSKFVELNKTVIDQETGKKVILNDMSQGKFDIAIDVVASNKTQRVEAANAVSRLAETIPAVSPFVADILSSNLDFPFAPELTKRIRRSQLGLPVIEPNKEEQGELAQQQQAQAQGQELQLKLQEQLAHQNLIQIQLQNELIAADVDKIDIENRMKEIDIQKKRADINKTLADSMLDKAKAGFPLTQDEIEAKSENIDQLNTSLDSTSVDNKNLQDHNDIT